MRLQTTLKLSRKSVICPETTKRVNEISVILNLTDFIDNRIERLSTGQTRRFVLYALYGGSRVFMRPHFDASPRQNHCGRFSGIAAEYDWHF